MRHSVQNLVALLSMLFLPASAAQAAPPTEVGARTAEVAAVAVVDVVGIDKETRTLTLKGKDSDEWTFIAGPEVRNFSQIKRGDRVIMEYYEGFALALGPKGSGVKERVDTLEVDRAARGEKPAAKITRTTVAVGMVMAVNMKGRTVTLEGVERTVTLGVSKDVDLSKIELGQAVEAAYIESFAVSVVPAPKVSGTVAIESTSVALGIGIEWGHGILTMHDGSTHNFKIEGLSVLDLGVSKVNITGEVFHLVEAKDLAGTFIAGEAGAVLIGGGSTIAMKNDYGVVMQLNSAQKGVRFTFAGKSLKVKLVR